MNDDDNHYYEADLDEDDDGEDEYDEWESIDNAQRSREFKELQQ